MPNKSSKKKNQKNLPKKNDKKVDKKKINQIGGTNIKKTVDITLHEDGLPQGYIIGIF